MIITISEKNKLCKVWKFLFGPVDVIRIKIFRVLLGSSLLIYMSFRWIYSKEWLTSCGFHLAKENHGCPELWVPLLPESLLPYFGIILFGSIIAFILGWQAYWSNWVVLSCIVYVTMADQFAAYTLNLMFMIALLTLTLSCRRDKQTDQLQSAWSLRILQSILITVFFLPGWSKAVYGEWLTSPYVLWTHMHGNYRTDFASLLLNLFPIKVWAIMQFGALLFELLSPLLFALKRLRWIGLLWGGIFQIIIALTLKHVVYFNLVVVSFFILFVDEKRLRQAANSVSNEISNLLASFRKKLNT